MNKVFIVLWREYLATVKTKTFVVAIVAMPLLGSAAAALPLLAQKHAAGRDRTCVVVDRTGQLYESLERAAKVNNRREREASGGSDVDRYLLERVAPAKDATAQGLALSERVRSGEIFAFLEIDETVFDPRAEGSARYYTATPSHLGLPRWLGRALEQAVHRARLQRAGVDPKVVRRAERPVELTHAALYEREQTGGIVQRGERNPVRDTVLPLALAIVMFLAVMMGAGPLMQSVLEEKMHRIAEILLSSVPPFQLMLGKLFGASAVSFTLLFIYVGGGAWLATLAGFDVPLDVGTVAWIVVFQAIALVMYGSIFLAVGSACSDLRQSQTLMLPVTIVIVSPMLLLSFVLSDPNGPVSTALSLVPFFTPLLMMLRVALPPGAPAWQAFLGVALSGSFALLCVVAAARVFRIGMLVQGSTPSPRELLRWIASD